MSVMPMLSGARVKLLVSVCYHCSEDPKPFPPKQTPNFHGWRAKPASLSFPSCPLSGLPADVPIQCLAQLMTTEHRKERMTTRCSDE